MLSYIFGVDEAGNQLPYIDFYAEKLFVIGTVGMAPDVYIVRENMGNVPNEYFMTAESWTVFCHLARFLFFKQ